MDFENNQIPQQAPVAPAEAQLPQANKPKSKLPMLIGVVAVVAIVAIIIALIGGGGYKKAVENTLELYFNYETSNIKDIVPDVLWEEEADEEDKDVDEIIDELVEDVEAEKEEAEEFGISVSYEIGEYEKMDKDDLEDLKENISDIYDCIDEDDIGNKAYKVEVSYEINYEEFDETEEDDMELFVVKINGDWYVVSEGGWFML